MAVARATTQCCVRSMSSSSQSKCVARTNTSVMSAKASVTLALALALTLISPRLMPTLGKHDAERGVRLQTVPPIVTIHLKRFAIGSCMDCRGRTELTLMKVNTAMRY